MAWLRSRSAFLTCKGCPAVVDAQSIQKRLYFPNIAGCCILKRLSGSFFGDAGLWERADFHKRLRPSG
jgi:hypothetical protein